VQIDNGSPAGGGSVSDLGGDAGQLKRYLGAIRRRWPILVACVVLAALVGWVTTPSGDGGAGASAKPYYKATHTLIDNTPNTGGDSSTDAGTTLATAAFYVTTGDVPVRTAAKLGTGVDIVLASVSATARGDVGSLEVSTVSDNPDEAVRLADTAASELVTYLGETESAAYNLELSTTQARMEKLKTDRKVLEDQIAITPIEERPTATPELDSIINQYRVAYERYSQLVAQGEPSAGLRTVQAATAIPITVDEYETERASIIAGSFTQGVTPTTRVSTSTTSSQPASAPLRAGAGGFLGLLLGMAIVLLLDRFDTRLRRRESVEAATGLPVLAEIPPLDRHAQHETRILAAAEPRSSTAEAYRVARTAIVFARTATPKATAVNGAEVVDAPKRGEVIMVTSPNPGEGKTTSCANLAAVFAEGGQSVLVIDCDFRRPRIHKYLAEGLSLTSGFESDRESTSVIAAKGQLKALASDLPGVRLVTGIGEAFPDASPIEIVTYQRQVIEFAREHFDIVLLDTAPFLTTNDASELLNETDVVVLVVRSGRTQFESAKRAAELLKRIDAPVLGVVLTGSADASAAQYYYRYYLDQDGSTRRRSTPEPEPAPPAANGHTPANGTSNGAGSEPLPLEGLRFPKR